MHYAASILLLFSCIDASSIGTPPRGHLALVTDTATDTDTLLRAVAIQAEADMQISTIAALRDGATMALDAASEAEADSQLDLGSTQGVGDGPATLEEYCAGQSTVQEKGMELKDGTKVMANWEGYGQMYPGRIEDKNVDGTVDIHYDDGFHEESVASHHVEIHPDEKKKVESTQSAKKRDDAACEMKDFLKEMKGKLKDLNGMIVDWMSSQRAKIAGDRAAPTAPPNLQPVTSPPPVAVAPAAAPPAAPATPPAEKSEELEKLQTQLAERDQYIEELEKRFEENNQELQKFVPAAPPAPAGLQTVDDLIQQYKAKIAQRDVRIQELEAAIAQQEKDLAKLSGKQLSLADIDAAIKMLEKEGDKAEQKRDELEKAGKLDSDLRVIINSILEALKKMRAKVDNLLALEAQAKERQDEANREALEAAKAARLRAKELGLDPDKAAEEAIAEAKRKHEAETKSADLEVMRAAQEVGEDMREAEVGAERLDTGLHPHGAKWWRYRYEHSYIEAILMIFISFLMLLWSEIIYHFRVWLNWLAVPGKKRSTAEELEEQDAHGAAYLSWLRMLTEQMCVCVFVFLTVWVIAKTALLKYAPMLIRPSDDMRVPLEPDEYRRLALDICTIFFIAIVFYFALMFSVARETRYETKKYEDLDNVSRSQTVAGSRLSGQSAERTRKKSMFSIFVDAKDYEDQLAVFTVAMRHLLENSTDEEIKENKDEIGRSLDDFPLHEYLTICVRVNVGRMFFFGWVMWLPTIALFLALCLLHRFAHMGYVRIMGVFGIAVLLLIAYMAYSIRHIREKAAAKGAHSTGDEKVSKISSELVVLGLLQFSLFFVCYGVARMICQSWMWELHFWPVLALTVTALISAFLFVWFIAPAIPSFCAAMAMPPYVDSDNLKCMLHVVKNPGSSEMP
jgi:hypothetical protein